MVIRTSRNMCTNYLHIELADEGKKGRFRSGINTQSLVGQRATCKGQLRADNFAISLLSSMGSLEKGFEIGA